MGDLDVNYIILLEVLRESVSSLLNNMENIVLTIPTNNPPLWLFSEIYAM